MADKNVRIVAEVEVKSGDAGQKVGDIKKGLNDVGAAAQQTGKQAEDGLGKLNDKLKDVPGPLGNVSKGFDGLLKGFKAIISNPIVITITLVVGALAALYKAFTSTNEGADKLEQVMAGVSAAVDVLRDRVLKVGGAIVKFFTGDFKGAAEEVRTAFRGMGDEIAAEFNKAAAATKVLQDVEDATRELGVTRAKLNRDLAEAKEIITDETASYLEKKKAIDLVRKAEEDQTSKELQNAKLKLQAQQELNALSDTSDEDLQREADLRASVFALEQKSAQDRRTFNKQEKMIAAQERAKAKAEKDEDDKAEKDRQERLAAANKVIQDAYVATLDARDAEIFKLGQAHNERMKALAAAGITDTLAVQEQYRLELEGINKKYDDQEAATQKAKDDKKKADDEKAAADAKAISDKKRADDLLGIENAFREDALAFEQRRKLILDQQAILLSDETLTDNQRVKIQKDTTDAIAKIDADEVAAKKLKYQVIANASEVLSEILGKQTAAGKALGIATALINTYQGASEVIRAKSTLPEPFGTISKIANVAAIIATGIKTVRSITAVQVPGAMGGGGSIPSMNVSAPLQSQVQTTTLNQAQVNQIGNVAARAYVVESDVSNAQERANRLNRAATIL